VKDEKRFAFPNPRLEYARMDDAKNNVGRKRLEPFGSAGSAYASPMGRM
jgi:hypothetical protein